MFLCDCVSVFLVRMPLFIYFSPLFILFMLIYSINIILAALLFAIINIFTLSARLFIIIYKCVEFVKFLFCNIHLYNMPNELHF